MHRIGRIKQKRAISGILILAIILSLVHISVFAAPQVSDAYDAAERLHTLDLFSGVGPNPDGSPNFDLDRTPTRNEAITMLVRLLGKESEALSGVWVTSFTDLDAWAVPYVGYAYQNGLTAGTSITTFHGAQPVTATQYITFVLRALGYSSGTDFEWDSAWELSDVLGFTDGRFNADTVVFLRGDVATISFNALSAEYKASDETLYALLIESGVFTQAAAERVGLYYHTETSTPTSTPSTPTPEPSTPTPSTPPHTPSTPTPTPTPPAPPSNDTDNDDITEEDEEDEDDKDEGIIIVPRLANTQARYAENWARVSPVQQFAYMDEGLAYAYVSENELIITTPDKALSIEMRYPLLGDVTSDDDGNFYVVWGRANETDDISVETVFISKYTPDGQHVRTTGFVGESRMGANGNTKYPFNNGNCVSAVGNGFLMVNYARSMYNGHQSNNVVGVRISDMSPVEWNSVWSIPYTSHSFNQSVIWSRNADRFVYADQGDAFSRGFLVDNNGRRMTLFHFYLEANANYNMRIVNRTFAQMGGLAEVSSGVAFVGASAKSINEAAKTEKQNLFVQVFNPLATEVSSSMFVGGTTRSGATSFDINDSNNSPLTPVTDYGVHWLTNYTDTDVIAPQVVAADDHLVILWATNDDTYYLILSASGDILVQATSLAGAPLNSFEKPVFHNGTVYWAAAVNERLRVESIDIQTALPTETQ